MIINRNNGYGVNDTGTDMTVAQRINARDNTRQKDISTRHHDKNS